jgi:translation initiation factor IF-2
LAEKMRVHILAKELNVSSKAIIDKCKAEGIDSVKNHMSTLSAGLHATIREWFSEGQHSTTLETSEPIDLTKVRIPKKQLAHGASDETDDSSSDRGEGAVGTEVLESPDFAGDEGSDADEPAVSPALLAESTVDTAAPPTAPAPIHETRIPDAPRPRSVTKEPPPAPLSPPSTRPEPPASTGSPVEDQTTDSQTVRKPFAPAGPQNVPAAAKLTGPRVVR